MKRYVLFWQYHVTQIFSSALTIPPSFTDSQVTFSTKTRAMPHDFGKENKPINDNDGFVPRPVVRKSLAPRQKPKSKQEELEDRKGADLDALCRIMTDLCNAYAAGGAKSEMSEECQHPASVATYWISKWVDYSDKYGIGK